MRPQVILELSGSHGGSLQNCVQLIEAAHELGCPVKFQRFEAARLGKRRAGISWHGKPQSEAALTALYETTETPATWWPDIIDALTSLKLPWSCSVFDQRDIDFMEGMDCPAYKIASYEIGDAKLIAAAARTQKPLTVSIPRRASPDQIKYAIAAADAAPAVTFLFATRYFENRNDYQRHFADEISRFRWIKAVLQKPLGLSDHSPPDCSLLAHYAVQWGAPMIERHLRLPGVDTEDVAFSLTPPQMDDYIDCVMDYDAEASQLPEAHAAEAKASEYQ